MTGIGKRLQRLEARTMASETEGRVFVVYAPKGTEPAGVVIAALGAPLRAADHIIKRVVPDQWPPRLVGGIGFDLSKATGRGDLGVRA